VARTFADLKAETLGNDFDSTTYSTRAGQYLNEALRRVARRARLPTLEAVQAYSTVASTATLALPTDEVSVISLRDTALRDPLTSLDINDIDDASLASGRPYAYALFGGGITLYPTPDGVYSLELRYRKLTGQFSGDGDTTTTVSFPDDYADVLVAYARWKLYRAEDDPNMKSMWEAEYRQQLAEMMADLQAVGEDRVKRTPSMWDTGDPPALTWR
jgi:hypothetical protein